MSDQDWPNIVSFPADGSTLRAFSPPTRATYNPRQAPDQDRWVSLLNPSMPPNSTEATIPSVHVTTFQAAHFMAHRTTYTPGHYHMELVRRLANNEPLGSGTSAILDALEKGERERAVRLYLSQRGLLNALNLAAKLLRELAARGELAVHGRLRQAPPSNALSPHARTSARAMSGDQFARVKVSAAAFQPPCELWLLEGETEAHSDLLWDLRDTPFQNRWRTQPPLEANDEKLADWRVRTAERIKPWCCRPEVLAEAHRRLNGGETKKRSVNGVLFEMARECRAGFSQDSIGRTMLLLK